MQARDHLDQLATAHPTVVARVLVEHADAESAVRPCRIDPAVVDDDGAGQHVSWTHGTAEPQISDAAPGNGRDAHAHWQDASGAWATRPIA